MISLNVKNGQNSLIISFDALNNSSLNCVDVDDATAANADLAPYTNWKIDATATFSEDCSALNIDDKLLAQSIIFYPNPVSDVLTIDSKKASLMRVEIFSILGKKVKKINSNFEAIKIDNLSKGVYLVRIFSDKGEVVKKMIKK